VTREIQRSGCLLLRLATVPHAQDTTDISPDQVLRMKFLHTSNLSLQAWSGPEGSRKLRFPDFMKTAQDGGKVVSLTNRPPLHPGNTPGTHFC